MNEYYFISLCLNSLHAGVRQYPGHAWCNTLEKPTGIIGLFFCSRVCMFGTEERAVENILTHTSFGLLDLHSCISMYLNVSQSQSRDIT